MELKKTAGENAAQKLARFLAKRNQELIEEGAEESLEIRLSADGSLLLLLIKPAVSPQYLYGASNVDTMSKYLEASMLRRLIMSVNWAIMNAANL
jgi:hypothetical protein